MHPPSADHPKGRHRLLIETNTRWLRQALRLLDSITDDAYTGTAAGLEPHRAGAHIRHILEFYDCFLCGMRTGHIDYDARRRDPGIERSRAEAARRIQEIIASLNSGEYEHEDFIVMVRMEGARELGMTGAWLASSVSRELQTLSSHTIHHFALISMTLRAQGVPVDLSFGVAPSTLNHQKRPWTASSAA
ncbi:MAG: hypothetical protein K2X35_02550 [Bryobacteraceae bacterium]|nr:hypothetical protein [Bryobacteraceae bacterium]